MQHRNKNVATAAQFRVLEGSPGEDNVVHMSRTTATFSVSLPPEMAAELEQVRTEEHRTRSELVREALRQYIGARTST